MDPNHTRRSEAVELVAALNELASLMLATPSLTNLLDELARLAAGVLTPRASCGITLRQDHQPLTVAASDALAAHLDEGQYAHDAGPCLLTLRSGRVTAVPDMAKEQRWGGYPARAVALGVRSSHSMPLAVDGATRGALNLYATTPGAFGVAETRKAEVFAHQASAAMTVVVRQAKQVQLTDQLRQALAARAVIDQALGMLMAQERCGRDTAFAILRSASQNRNKKLRDVATEIVTAVSRDEPTSAPFNDPE